MRRSADVVVIGTGVAGLSTALALAATRDVLLVSAGSGSTPWAQGGIAAAYGDDDPLGHAHDTEVAGAGFCDPRNVRALVEEGPQRLAELVALGTRFDRDADGSLSRTLEGGHDRRRVVHAGGDASGAEVHRALLSALHLADVQTVQGRAIGLIKSGSGSIAGVLVEEDAGIGQIDARAVVLATGGIGNAYLASTNPSTVRGDGIALALQAGASLVDMEFVQFHPTALFTGDLRGQLPLVTEAVRGEGAVLRDFHGRRIMTGVHPRADLAPRDIVAQAIESTMRRDGCDHVWLDARSIPADTVRRRFPTVLASCRQIGVDMLREPIPVTPAEHFLCGGIRTNRDGATDVPGLYAVGEAAASGVHGANRLASNSLLEGLVFGRRVATALTLALPAASDDQSSSQVMGEDDDPQTIRAILSKYAGIRRDGSGLRAAQDELEFVGDGPLATVARTVVAGAITREDSRGCHWRSDHPRTDERWDKHLVIRLDEDGRPAVYISRPERRAPAPRAAHQTAVAVGAMADAVR
ncbi:MAG: L-aspartate oxidase, partial [Actinomycetia bacterium]|nr:L-aspartate oxidase [Actinomycetes bacterium]